MVDIRLIEKNENFVRYAYYPNGKKEEKGTVVYDRKTGDYWCEQEKPFFFFLGHVFSFLRECIEKDEFPDRAQRIWY